LIAAVSGKISGVVSAQVKGRSAYLFDLFVMKPQRGRGVARALFAAVERHCQERGARRLALHCEKGSGNEAWYRRMGYMRRTEHTDFWGGRPGSKSTTLVYMVKRIEPLMRGVNRA
jgi:GNAT superfamily N-acetyltransferase